MLEFPETTTIAKQISNHIVGKRIRRVFPPTKAHKFCWYAGDPADYDVQISGSTVQTAREFGIFVEIAFDNGNLFGQPGGYKTKLSISM